MKKSKRKLQLVRESVRLADVRSLNLVAGAAAGSIRGCQDTRCDCPCGHGPSISEGNQS